MLIGPFRMYFVKKRVTWDLVDARALQPAAGPLTGQERCSIFLLTSGAKCSTPAILRVFEWNHAVEVEHAAPPLFTSQL